MKKQKTAERIALMMLAFIFVLIMIPATYFDMGANTEITLVEFIKGNASPFLIFHQIRGAEYLYPLCVSGFSLIIGVGTVISEIRRCRAGTPA